MAYSEAQKLGFIVIPAGLVLAAIFMALRTSRRSKPLGTVAGTSALVAAVRAVESSNPEPLFVDPLAEAMAGKENMAEIRQFINDPAEDISKMQLYSDLVPVAGRRRRLGWVHVRTLYLDKAISEALAGHSGKQQVVLLGAGLDARPWRMELPENVNWYEADQVEVIQYKQKILKSAGAAVEHGVQGAKHPLKSIKWIPVATDLSQLTWQKDLLTAGFDPAVRTIWVAEGLVNYIPEDGLRKLLHGVAEVSTRDSLLLLTAASQAWEKARSDGKGPWRLKLASVRPWGAPSLYNKAREFFDSVGWTTTAIDEPESVTESLTKGRCDYNPRLADVKDQLDEPADYLFCFVAATPLAC